MLSFMDTPIPSLRAPVGWERLPITGSSEPLVPISTIDPALLAVSSLYEEQAVPGALTECYARAGVAERLVAAARTLPNGMRLLVRDAWRPMEVQAALFNEHAAYLAKRYPTLSADAITRKAREYVSIPSTDPACPPPHSTGGAVDLTILLPTDRPIRTGSKVDTFGKAAHTRRYEEWLETGKALTARQVEYMRNRRLLFWTMVQVGFTNYRSEWWHFDYGNQFWGIVAGQQAIYNAAGRPN